MKILVQNNTNLNLERNFLDALYFFVKRGININFVFNNVDVPVSIEAKKTVQGFNPVTGKPQPVKYYGLKSQPQPVSGYDGTIFVWDINRAGTPTDGSVTSWAHPNCTIELAINQYLKENGKVTNRITHEIMHLLCYKFGAIDEMDVTLDGKPFYKNDDPDAPDGNYARTFKNLQPFINSLNKPMYKYFKPSEVIGLKPEFVKLLDEARGIAGVPFKITSGYRTTEHNANVGGVKDSSHTTGLAVDLQVKDGVSGGKILLALVKVGLNRFGFYEDGHIHVDFDMTKPNPCYWIK